LLFRDLNLIPSILSAVEAEGYTSPTPIQAAAIPPLLEGRDLVGVAQTGTGKTAAFALPMLQRLAQSKTGGGRPVRALILTPTRELALQIEESFTAYGKNLDLRHTVIFGGVGEAPQKAKLRSGVDIVVATPGRLLDLLGQRALTLQHLEIFTLDEADRMLDMGFVHDVKRICAMLPPRRQTLLFSATMPQEIRKLADGLLHQPVKVEVTPVSSTAEKIEQNVYHVSKDGKAGLLRHILADEAVTRVLVFTRTKHGADRLKRNLEQHGIPAEAIHGNKSQGARVRSLSNFKDGSSRVLVATDLAARGIDVDEISHVVNYDLPNEPETYVHRIGRTARAGRSGISYSFCTPDDRGFLHDIEKLIRMRIAVAATPAADAMRAPEPQAIQDRGRDQNRGQERSEARQGGEGQGGRGRRRRGRGNGGNAQEQGERRDSGHRRASTGHNPAGRQHEGRRAEVHHEGRRAEGREGQGQGGPRHEGKPRDTRPGHMRGHSQEGQTHGNSSGRRKHRGERTFVREYYSNDR
jgi:ATP-dependent RNA helicase RhlE